jgi:hypothetical protein
VFSSGATIDACRCLRVALITMKVTPALTISSTMIAAMT